MLLGRETEADHLERTLRDGGSVVLHGAAGIGKTTLARDVAARLGRWHGGGALATLSWSPLFVFQRLLGGVPPSAPEQVAARVLRAGHDVVVLDDLQWADDASLEVIGHLVGRLPVVATVRSGEPRSELTLGALGLVGFTDLHLGPLAPVEAGALVDRLHPDLDADERRSLLAGAGGNPLLLAELPGGTDGPPTLVSALLTRVGALDDDGRAAIERLAVMGRPTPVALLGPGSAAVVAAGLATERRGHLEVRHGLLAEVLVESLGPKADDLRRHLAPLVDPGEAVHLLAAAGERAAARELALDSLAGAEPRARAELLCVAVECAPPGDLDGDHRLAAARLLTATGQPARARALCSVAGVADLPPLQRGALRAAEGEAAWLQGHQEECRALVSEGLEDLRGTRSASEVLALAGSTIFQTWMALDGRPALERAREAVALAEEIGQEQGYARARLASVLFTAGEPGWAETYEQVVADARADGDDDVRRTALGSLLLARWVTGDVAEAERLALAEVDAGPLHDLDGSWLGFVAYAALLGLQQGRDQAALVDRFGPVLAAEPVFRGRPFLDVAVCLALADQGRSVEASDLAAGAPTRAGLEPQWRSVGWWAAIEVAWLTGRPEDAVAAGVALEALGVGDYPSAVQGRILAAHAGRELGRPPEGPVPGVPLPAWQGAPLEWLAISAWAAGDHAGAVAGFEAAAVAWAPFDVRSEVRCRWAAADAAVRGELPGAVDAARAAESLARSRGLAPLLARAEGTLRRAGVRRGGSRGTGPAGLTEREEAVVDLVGAGLTTAEIAARLEVAPSTVDSFVRSATRKLGATTRLAAVARLRERRDGSG